MSSQVREDVRMLRELVADIYSGRLCPDARHWTDEALRAEGLKWHERAKTIKRAIVALEMAGRGAP